MFFTSPTSNITPPLVSTAMTRSDSRDSTTSTYSFNTAAMHVSYSTSPSTYRSSSQVTTSSTRASRDSFSSGWLPSPYRSCMTHNSSSQGYESSSSYISDDDLLAIDELTMPPVEYIPLITSAPQQSVQQSKREMTTEEHIAMLREMQEREQAQVQQQRQRAQQQRTVRFAAEQRKPRRSSNLSQRRSTTVRRV